MKKRMLLTALAICLVCVAFAACALAEDPETPELILTSDTVEVGTPLTGRFTGLGQGEEYYYITVYKYIGSSEGDNARPDYYVYSSSIEVGDTQEILTLIPAESVDDPGEFLIRVNAGGNNIDVPFTVTGNRPAAPTAVASETEIIKDYTMTIEITGPEDVTGFRCFRYKDGVFMRIQNLYGTPLNGRMTMRDSFSEEGEYGFEFQAKVGGVWSEPSERLNLHCHSLGQIETPVALDVPETLKAGAELNILLEPVPHAEWYSFSVQGDHEISFPLKWQANTAGRVCVAPVGLDAGRYTLRITAGGRGYTQSEAVEYEINVTGTRPDKAQVKQTIPPGTKRPGETVWVSLSAAGLEKCMPRYRYMMDEMDEVYFAENGTAAFPVRLDDSAKYKDNYYARINGRWTGPINVSIKGTPWPSTGDYPWASYTLGLTLPKSIQLGNSLTFTTELWNSADYYTYSLSYVRKEGKVTEDGEEWPELEQIVYEEVFKPDSAGKGTIPAQYFTKAGKWAVGVNAYSGNGWTRYAGGYVTVEENSDRPEAPHIEMLTENPRMNEPVLFRNETNGAEQVCVIAKIPGEEDYVSAGPYVLDADSGEQYYIYEFSSRDFIYSYANEFRIRASVCVNGVWSDYSDYTDFTLACDGDLEMSSEDITVEPKDAAPGQVVTVSWLPPEGAGPGDTVKYRLTLKGPKGEKELGAPTEERYAEIPTEGKDAGSYEIRIEAFAPGKRSAVASADLNLVNEAWKPTVSVSKGETGLNGKVTVTVKTTGGKALFIYLDGEMTGIMKRSASGSQQFELKLDRIGTHRIQAMAVDRLPNPTVKSAMSDPARVLVADPDQTAEIVIPDGVTRVEAETFAGVEDKKVWVPATVTFISDSAFHPSVTIVTPYGSYAETWARNHGLEVINK